MVRLFSAIDLPDKVKQQLHHIQDPNQGVRWTPSDTLHLTLRFIGNVGIEMKNELADLFSGIEHRSFSIMLKGTGYFPSRKYPRIIWAGIGEGKPLILLQEKIEQACRFAGLDPEDRPFKPHVTIGRVQGASKKEIVSFINRHSGLKSERFPVKEFILYESRLRAEGPVHRPLRRFPLKDRAEIPDEDD